MRINFASPALPPQGALALLVREGAADAVWSEADDATGGALRRAMQVAEFKGKKESTCTILAPGAGLSRVVLVGLGAEPAALDYENAAGQAVAACGRDEKATIWAADLPADLAAAAAFGAQLRSYRFDRYRTKEKPEDKPLLTQLTILAADSAGAENTFANRRAVADGVFLGRDLVSEPPNVLTPAEMACRCEKLRALGVEVDVLGPEKLEQLGFGALLGVARGSCHEPRVVAMRWRGAKTDQPIAFIGKGVTFDSGGISIKPAGGMEDMKWDMAGSAAVVGAMAALAGRKARADVIGIVGLVENMPSGTAQRPSDVVKTLSGQTVEIINTDAEGRLVLADVVWWCQETYKPKFMVDLATLTGAMVVALGHEQAGMFASCDTLAAQLNEAGAKSGDKLWRMPLGDAYDKHLKSDIADMKNTGERGGGSISAAHFIKRFTNDVPWAHLDIAGMAWRDKDAPTIPKGATAFGVRLLDQLVADFYETP